MNKWRKLDEIDDWRSKKIEHKYGFCIKDGNVSKCQWSLSDATEQIAKDFDSLVWREAELGLPSYDEWYRQTDSVICESDNELFYLYDFITRKELLRRYIEHLAGIVNDGWVYKNRVKHYGIYMVTYNGTFDVLSNHEYISSEIKYKSSAAAQRIIDHCPNELKELYGVSK